MTNEWYALIGDEWDVDQTIAHPVWETRMLPALRQLVIVAKANNCETSDEERDTSSDQQEENKHA